MIDVSGLWFRAITVGGLFIFLGLIIALLIFLQSYQRKKRNKNHVRKKIGDLIFVSVTIVLGVVLFSYYASKAISPDVEIYIGQYQYENHTMRTPQLLPLTREYFFIGDHEVEKKGFLLDSISMKNVFPYEFEKSCTYQIWYDKSTRVILRVECIS